MWAAVLLSHMSDDEYEILIIPLSCPHIIVLLTVNATCCSMAAELNGLESHCRNKVSGQHLTSPPACLLSVYTVYSRILFKYDIYG